MALVKVARACPCDCYKIAKVIHLRRLGKSILTTYLVIAKGEVESSNVHASFNHLDHLLLVRAGWSQSCNNGCLSLIEIDLLEDVLESNTT